MFVRKTAALAFLLALMISVLTGCGNSAAHHTPPSSSSSSSSSDSAAISVYPYPDVREELKKAKEENSDVVAWLTVPGTEIDEPVVKGKDNSYYLRKDYKKNYSFAGSYFMDYRNSAEDLSQNTIIYGHNLGTPIGTKDNPNGVKFAQLLRFIDPDFAREHPYLYLTTEENHYVFEIFAVFYAEAYTKPVEYHHDQYSDTDFTALMEDVAARSLYDYGVTPEPADRILTLSTCSYKFGTYSQNPNQRFVVMGRLIEDGKPYAPTVALWENPSPKQPSF